jgi:signal transduction histidine kinase
MGLVGLVLLIVLAASVVSGYQSELQRVETVVNQALNLNSDSERSSRSSEQPLMELFTELQKHNPLLPSDQKSTEQLYEQEQNPTILPDNGPFTPVYIALADRPSSTILADNSAFIMIDNTLTSKALTRIEERLAQQGSAQNTGTTGLLFDLKLFYRAERIGDTGMLVALADASSLINSTLRMAGFSAFIWLGAMGGLFVISLLLSRMALRPVTEAWERQRRFVADASHELKTPLTVILANNSLLLAHPDKTIAEQQKWVDSTQAEAQRMDHLVRDLLLLAQTDEGKGFANGETATQHPVDLSTLTRRNLLQFEAVFFERGITLTAEIDDGVIVSGNEEQLGRLIQILLDNASKYAKTTVSDDRTQTQGKLQAQTETHTRAQVSAQVSVETQVLTQAPAEVPAETHTQPSVLVKLNTNTGSKQHAILKVINNGKVIERQALSHLFERFYRADHVRGDIEGSGLGLSLAQAIVKAHHGTIEVSSDTVNGTVFVVTLTSKPNLALATLPSLH